MCTLEENWFLFEILGSLAMEQLYNISIGGIMHLITIIIHILIFKKIVNLSARITALEELVKPVKIQTEEINSEVVSSRDHKVAERKPVFTQSPLIYPVTVQQMPDQMATQNIWAPIEMLDLKRFKEAIVSYGMHSPYVKQMLNSWSTYNRIVPQDWRDLAQAVLEPSQRLQFLTWFKEEAKNIEKQWRDKGIQVCQDQLMGEGQYASAQTQCLYDVQTLILCRTAALNAWDKVEEPGKKSESFTKVKQGPKESFTDFLQRLASAVKRMVSDSEASKAIIESLAFENANAACKRIIRPLRARSAPMEDWIRETINVEADEHDDTWVGEVISKGLRSVRCFGCGKQGHLKRDCRQVIPRNNVSSRNNGNRMPLPSGVCRRCGKGKHWTNECRSTKDRQGNPLPQSSGNSQRGLMQGPIAKPVQTFQIGRAHV